jgi:hypothetical protein
MTLEQQLIAILQEYCGERGDNEGAADTLKRIIRERDEARALAQTWFRDLGVVGLYGMDAEEFFARYPHLAWLKEAPEKEEPKPEKGRRLLGDFGHGPIYLLDCDAAREEKPSDDA